MTDQTVDLSQPLSDTRLLLKLVDNGDDTFSIAATIEGSSLPSGAASAANQALELTELRSMNLLSSVVFDTILVTYVDATKAVISKVEWKLSGDVVKTLTPTFGAATDTWVKS